MFVQEQRYFDRMAQSVDDKSGIVRYISEHFSADDVFTIVDVGAGGGELSLKLSHSFPQATVYSLDASPEAIQQLQSKGLNTVQAYADEILSIFGENSVDVVVASSIIHEIFSYGNSPAGFHPGSARNVEDFVGKVYQVLTPGGIFINRDGVRPRDSQKTMSLYLPESLEPMVARFMQESPFYGMNSSVEQDSRILFNSVENLGDEIEVISTLGELWELLFTLNWGEGSFDREVQEFYGYYSVQGFVHLATSYGFEKLVAYDYFQEDYDYYLGAVMGARLVSLDGKRVDFPNTNALYVFKK